MGTADNSTIGITIKVIDANSGQTVSAVTKNINELGTAGAASGAKMKAGLDGAGEAGVGMGKKVGAGMREAGQHSLNALDNVRLVRDDLGIRIPRAMEKVISQSKLAMGAIGAFGTGLVALGAIEVVVQMGRQVYELYEKWLDTNKAIKDYREEAAKASQQKLFDEGSFNTTLGFLNQANAQITALEAKKKARDKSSILDNIFLPNSTAQRFTMGDSRQLAQAMEVHDKENLRTLQQTHDLMMKNIEAHNALAQAGANSAAKGAIERRGEKQQHLENLRYAGEVERANAEIYNRAHARDPKKFPGTYQPSKDAGRQEFDADENNSDLKRQASSTEVGLQQQKDLMKLKQEADAVGLAGDRQIQAQRVAAIEDLNAKYNFQTSRNRQYKLEEEQVNRRFDNEEQHRLEEQTNEVRKRVAEAASQGLTGMAAIDARANAAKGQVDEDLAQHKFYGNKDQQQEHAAGLKGAIDTGANQERLKQQESFNERMAQLDAARADRYESESDKITSSAARSATEITKAWREEYGQLGPLDQRRVSSYQALQDEIVKINADAAKQRFEASRRIEDDTVKLEHQAARLGQPKEREETQAIVDAYNERYQHLEELRQQDSANKDKYRRQEIAEEAIKNGKLLDQQRQMRDKLAGVLEGLWSNPLEALKKQGEQMASKAAATYFLKLAHPQAGTMGTGGKSGGNLFGLPESWMDVGGFNHRQRGAGMPGMSPRPGSGGGIFSDHPTGHSDASTISAATATIHVQSATITGLGGGGGMRNAVYQSGGGFGGVSATGSGGGFSEGVGGSSTGVPSYTSSSTTTPEAGARSAIGTYQDSQRMPGGVASSISAGVSQLGGMTKSADQLGKELGMSGSLTSKIPGGNLLGKLGDPSTKLGGAFGGAMGLFSAFEGGGGFGGALQGGLAGAQFGAQFGGPMGAAIGGLAGAAMGFLGFGARSKAASYNKHTVKPQLAAELLAFEAGSSDYQTVYNDFDKLQLDAKLETRKMGSGAKGYYEDTIRPEIDAAQKRLTREQQAGRSQFGMQAAQFHTGGLISGFGDLGTSTTEGFIHAMMGERVINPVASTSHAPALDAINSGASHGDMAAYYGAGAGTAAVASSPADVNLHFHSADAKGARELLMNNMHHVRAAVNASYGENSGGYDIA